MNTDQNVIRLSPGVALAIKCTGAWGNLCGKGAKPTVYHPDIAQVYPAHLGELEWYTEGRFTPTSYVVVGLRPGETALRVPGEDPLSIVVQE